MPYSFFDVSNVFNNFNMLSIWSNRSFDIQNFSFQNTINYWNAFNFWNPTSVFQNSWNLNSTWNPFQNISNPVCTGCFSATNAIKSESAATTQQNSSVISNSTVNSSSTNTSVEIPKAEDTNAEDKKVKTPNDCFCNYKADTGEKLAKIALKNSDKFHNQCATHVQNAIAEAGLGTCPNVDAYQMSEILRNNSNFEEISTNNLELKNVPAGCIFVYDQGTEGVSKEYGHCEITLGDGRAVSDGITEKFIVKPTAVFAPIV